MRANRWWLPWPLVVVVGCGRLSGPDTAAGDVPAYAEVVRFDTIITSSGEGYDLYDVSHVRTLSDGRFVVLNAGVQEVLVFSRAGHLENRFGGPGDGPGEFAHPWFLTTLPGDSILVTDRPLPQQSVVFTSEGELARTFTLETPEVGTWHVFPEAITDDGFFVAIQGIEPVVAGVTAGIRRVELRIVVYDLGGQLLHYVSRPEIGIEYWLVEVDGRLRSTRPPFLEQGFVAAGRPGIVMADGDSPELLWLNSDVQPRDTIRTVDTRSALPSSVFDSVRHAWAEAATTEPGRVVRRRILGDLPAPTHPLIADVQFDREGRLWIARAAARGGRDPTWLVHAGDSLLGRVELPTEIKIREIGAEHVIAVQSDSLGVESVVRLELRVEQPLPDEPR